MAQLVARVHDGLLRQVDELVQSGFVASRSEAVRLALAELVERQRRRAIGEQIRREYRDHPQTEDEFGWTDQAALHMIAEEPW